MTPLLSLLQCTSKIIDLVSNRKYKVSMSNEAIVLNNINPCANLLGLLLLSTC